MRGLKIYLGIVTVLLIMALGFGVYVWYIIQKLQSPSGMTPLPVSDEDVVQTKDQEVPQ